MEGLPNDRTKVFVGEKHLLMWGHSEELVARTNEQDGKGAAGR
jgi:hypothetical protein